MLVIEFSRKYRPLAMSSFLYRLHRYIANFVHYGKTRLRVIPVDELLSDTNSTVHISTKFIISWNSSLYLLKTLYSSLKLIITKRIDWSLITLIWQDNTFNWSWNKINTFNGLIVIVHLPSCKIALCLAFIQSTLISVLNIHALVLLMARSYCCTATLHAFINYHTYLIRCIDCGPTLIMQKLFAWQWWSLISWPQREK